MRLIPVIDLKDGLVVHAIKGERDRYKPVQSVLVNSADPIAVARAYRDQLGLEEIYVADLDAIQQRGDHREIIAQLASDEGMVLMVDAGAIDPATAQALVSYGVERVVIGSETLESWEVFVEIQNQLARKNLVFSLDMRYGEVISRCTELRSQSPLQALAYLQNLSIFEVILLDLALVGTGFGVAHDLIQSATHKFPEMKILVGGGIRDKSEVLKLKTSGVSGLLIATSLHQGKITASDIRQIREG